MAEEEEEEEGKNKLIRPLEARGQKFCDQKFLNRLNSMISMFLQQTLIRVLKID